MDKAILQYIDSLLDVRIRLNEVLDYREENIEGDADEGSFENIIDAADSINAELESFNVDVDEYFSSFKLVVNGKIVDREGK